MVRNTQSTVPSVSKACARRHWIRAQQLHTEAPLGDGLTATQAAIEHLGYLQIDTINVIERCHHHILYTRIPGYKRSDLATLQSSAKSIFEYWTHALAYVPSSDYRYFMGDMERVAKDPGPWLGRAKPAEVQKVLKRIELEGPLTLRDIDDDVLVEKDHEWASRKPSKRALSRAFHSGLLTINAREGMLKSYELTHRHFGWKKPPKPATEKQCASYVLDRALRAQGWVSLDSVCYLRPKQKPAVLEEIERRVKKKLLVALRIEGLSKPTHWIEPERLEQRDEPLAHPVALLSPFDPLMIQRKRVLSVFEYMHVFEAYLPKDRRKYGYFALPVLLDEKIVAAIDLKTDRIAKKLLIQQWTWIAKGKSREHKRRIEEQLDRFERFQLGG